MMMKHPENPELLVDAGAWTWHCGAVVRTVEEHQRGPSLGILPARITARQAKYLNKGGLEDFKAAGGVTIDDL